VIDGWGMHLRRIHADNDYQRQQMVTLLGSVFEREKDSDVLDGIDMLKRQGWGNGRAYYLYLMPIHNHHEDARPLMLGVHLMVSVEKKKKKLSRWG
jgi:hypothetical protein